MSTSIAVLGAGNWGTTLAHLIARNGYAARLWTRDPNQRDEINMRRHNSRSLPGLTIAPGVRAVSDLAEALSGVELVFVAIPSQAFREVCRAARDELQPGHLVIHGTKGLEIDTHCRMSEILLAETSVRQLGVLAGPNIAAEIAEGKPAGTVIASTVPRLVDLGRAALSSTHMMVFESSDVLGVELCGALKNVVAIAAGIADEMRVGDNAKAFLVSRGMSELMRLAFAMGAEPMTMAGLAGIGDLMVTCASPLSRNHQVGVALARGEKLGEIVARLHMVAEGVYASLSARALAKAHGLELPLFEHVDRVLREGLSPEKALDELMRLPAGHDVPRFANRVSP
ncbi:MAG: NAD(P)H-dependent glycerol-3-phosphate dehydrogenase [Polyangiaceae bacterium]